MRKRNDSSIVLKIFNTENIIETIALTAKSASSGYIPNFTLIIENSGSYEKFIEVFEGFIAIERGTHDSYKEILAKYFDGVESNVLLYAHLHGVAQINSQILSSLGLKYSVRYRKIEDGIVTQDLLEPIVRGQGISGSEKQSRGDLIAWMAANPKDVAAIQRTYKSHHIQVIDLGDD
jgi:hypothetical protein